MSHFGDFLDLLQKLFTVVGTLVTALGVLRPTIRRWLDERGDQSRHPPSSAAASKGAPEPAPISLVERLKQRLAARQGLVELSFAVVLAAAFAVIFADTLLASSTGEPDPLVTFAKTLALTSVVGTLLFAGWFQRQLEFVSGMLAVTAMASLLLAGPASLLRGSTDGDPGNVFLMTLLGLLTLATGTLTFLFGNPLGSGRERGRALLWTLGVVLTVGLAATLVGRQKVQALARNPNVPSVYTEPVESFAKLVGTMPLEARRATYQLASEIAVTDTYRNEHESVEERYRDDHAALEKAAAKAKLRAAKPAAAGATSAPALAPSSTSPEAAPPGPHDSELGPESSDGDLGVPSAATIQRLQLSELQREQLGSGGQRFNRMAPSDRATFMLARLAWIHPLGSHPGDLRAATPMPGTTSSSRLEATSQMRIDHALAAETNLGTVKTEPVRPYPTPPTLEGSSVIRGLFEYPKLEPLRQDELFTPLANDPVLTDLKAQLTWPASAESWAAYEEYLAISLFGKSAEVRALYDGFAELDGVSRAAIRQLLASKKGDDFQALYKVAGAAPNTPTIDFAAITDASSSYDLITIARKLENPESLVGFADERGKKLTDEMVGPSSPLGADERRSLADLLLARSAQALFKPHTLEWIANVGKRLNIDQRREFFSLLSDPVAPAVEKLGAEYQAKLSSTHGLLSPTAVVDALRRFRGLKVDERESALLRLARDLYGAGGPASLLLHEQLVYQARATSLNLGVVVAGSLTLPLFALAVLFGTYLARKLRSHYQQRALMDRESEEANSGDRGQNAVIIGEAMTLRGRKPTLQTLEDLGRRGWTTTAVVGRRGIGKSRALYELLKGPDESASSRIPVWVAVPTEFDEREFVITVLERLAEGVERTVARFLGAEPLAVREGEAKFGAIATAICLLGAGLTWLLAVAAQTGSDEIAATAKLVPTAALLLIALGLMAAHVLRLQPVNLQPWLERDRSYQVATVLLYREAGRVRSMLSNIKVAGRRLAFVLVTALLAAAAGIGTAALLQVFDVDDENTKLLGAGAAAGLVLLARLWRIGVDSTAAGDRGFMTLVASYRSFAQSVVKRLGEGALGPVSQDARVVIAIDELDKMAIDTIRVFVRRIKAVFEVPGVYYYVSISEDALARLYLGASVGKDEFDSSFDHMVQVEPLSVEESAKAAGEFLESTKVGVVEPRLLDVIGVISCGVPRDILRRADEVRTWGVTTAVTCVQQVRRRHAQLGYRSNLVSRADKDLVFGACKEVDQKIVKILASGKPLDPHLTDAKREEVLRYWLLAWIFAALEVISASETLAPEWHVLTEKLRDLAYRIVVDPCVDLAADVRILQPQIFRPRSEPVSASRVATGHAALADCADADDLSTTG